jgi:hypothetical protein
MAVTVSRLEAVLRADTSQFDRSMDKSEGKMHSVGKVAGVAGLAIAGGLAVGLDKSVKAAMEAQTSTTRLEQAFKNAHLSATLYAGAIDKAESSGRKLGFTDEETKTSLGSLITAVHSVHKATSDMAVAQDIARFKGVGLTDATKMLTMAMTGSQRATKQLGINVSPVTITMENLKKSVEDNIAASHKDMTAKQAHSATLAFFRTALGQTEQAQAKLTDKQLTGDSVIKAVSEHLHGQADAYSKTAAGGMAQFHAQLDHLEVKAGTGLLPVLGKVATALSGLVDWFGKNTVVAKALAIAAGIVGGALLAVSVATKVATAATKIYTAAQWLLNVALDANPIGIVVLALAGLGVAFYEAYKHIKFFREGVQAAWDWIKGNWPLILGILTGPIGVAVVEIIKHRDKLVSVFTSLPGEIGSAVASGMGDLKDKLQSLFSWHRIVGWVRDALGFGSPSPHFMAIGADMVDSMIRGVGGAAGLLKDAVVRMAKDVALGPLGAVRHAAGSVFGKGGTQPPGVYGSGNLVPQVADAVSYARSHGWHGVVTSGYRTYAQQAALYQRYLHGGPLAAKPGTSSHELGQAVDVTDYQTFGRIMAKAPSFERLYNRLGAADPVHFSVTGYDKGGWLPQGLSLALNTTGRPERVGGGGGDIHVTNIFPGYVGDESVVAAVVRDTLESFQNRNGRPAYGSGF